MHLKFKGEEVFHICQEHLKELGKLDANGNLRDSEKIVEEFLHLPSDKKICKVCEEKAKEGNCKPFYTKRTKFGSENDN